MNAALNEKLAQLRARLEYSPEMGKTPVIPIKVIPVKPRLAKPTRDDEPTEADCKRVGGVLKMVFGRAMCLPASQTHVIGVPAVQRRVREQLEWMRARLEASLSED